MTKNKEIYCRLVFHLDINVDIDTLEIIRKRASILKMKINTIRDTHDKQIGLSFTDPDNSFVKLCIFGKNGDDLIQKMKIKTESAWYAPKFETVYKRHWWT